MKKMEDVYAKLSTPGCVKEGYLFKKSSSKMLQVFDVFVVCAAFISPFFFFLAQLFLSPYPPCMSPVLDGIGRGGRFVSSPISVLECWQPNSSSPFCFFCFATIFFFPLLE